MGWNCPCCGEGYPSAQNAGVDESIVILIPPPSSYVQWRRPGEVEWHDYNPYDVPWDLDRIEIRLLPR